MLLLKWIADAVHAFADYASTLGIVVSIVGFAITIVNVVRSKNAAQKVATAISEVRQSLTLQVAVSDLSRIMSDVDDLKTFHRSGAWDALPPRYDSVRRQLLAVKMSYPNLSKSQRSTIQGIIGQFTSIGQVVEEALAARKAPDDIASLNNLVTEQGDKLNVILVAVQKNIGAKS